MRVAILGAAHFHVNYALEELKHRPDLKLVGAAESDPAMREQFLGDLPGEAPVYASVEELTAAVDFDVALVAGVYNQRAAATLAALDSGAHVLADKPLCTSLDDLDRIERAAERANKHVSVVFEKRFYPATLALQRLLDDGVLGKIERTSMAGQSNL